VTGIEPSPSVNQAASKPKPNGDYMAETSAFDSFAEKHYAPTELAELWGLHPKTVRTLFQGELGVLVLGNTKTTRYRKAYTTLRIPASVAQRVHRRLEQN
jgi:hypothetical protein